MAREINAVTELQEDSFYRELLSFDAEDKTALYAQLFVKISQAIESMQLLPGQLLPSTRELPKILGVSRSTVARTYDQLISQGYLKTVEGIGTFVTHSERHNRAPEKKDIPNHQVKLSDYANRLMATTPTILAAQHIPQLNYGAPPPDLLPTKQWRQIMLKHCREHDPSALDYDSQPFGYRPLREAIAAFLARFRGMRCSSDQIMVFVDAIYPLALVARLLVNENDVVAMDEPGYPYARLTFSVLGAQIMPVPVDQMGTQVEKLTAAANQCRLAFVVPSHQDPLGYTLSLERRKDLVAWAQQSGALIIEDDWEYEYIYGGLPLPSVHSLDASDSVVYVSKFYKVLFPLSNVGFVVIPKRLIPVFERAKLLLQSNVSTKLSLQDQHGLTAFINEGGFERHIRKTQIEYASRRQAFIAMFSKHLREFATLAEASAAMHFVVRFRSEIPEEQVLQCAAQSRLQLVSSRPYYLLDPVEGEFLFPFAQIKAELMERSFQQFSQLLAERPRS